MIHSTKCDIGEMPMAADTKKGEAGQGWKGRKGNKLHSAVIALKIRIIQKYSLFDSLGKKGQNIYSSLVSIN